MNPAGFSYQKFAWQARDRSGSIVSPDKYFHIRPDSHSLQKIALNARSSEGLQRVDGPAVLFGQPDASQAEVADASKHAKLTAPARTIC